MALREDTMRNRARNLVRPDLRAQYESFTDKSYTDKS